MPQATGIESPSLEDVFRSATIHAWDEFTAITTPHAIRVEYVGAPGGPVDELTVWLVSAGGYQERICDYRLDTFLTRSREWCCWTRLHSPKLVGALDLIMRNQDRFRRAPGSNRNGLVVVLTPTPEARTDAAAGMIKLAIPCPSIAVMRSRAASISLG
jgi:hypothetical protein